MSTEPSEEDVKNAKKTADLLSGLIQMAFDVNHNIPPMPPWPAIPKTKLASLAESSESLVMQLIAYCKQLKRHAESKGVDVGPLVNGLASLDVQAVGITYEHSKTS